MPLPIRINKLLSQLGIASRRKADELIKKGRVFLNGKPLLKPGVLVDTQKDNIEVNGRQVLLTENSPRLYILLNKPRGHVTTVKDTHRRRTVMDLVPKGKGLFPVGRLDRDTTGLLLITNDGEIAHRLMHPRYSIEKLYEVVVSGAIKRSHIEKITSGVNIGDEKPSAFKVSGINRVDGSTKAVVELHEGRKRQIRRTFTALGYRVLSLNRIAYAGLKLDVKEGAYRVLTEEEVAQLKAEAGLK